MTNAPAVSVVVPCFRNADALAELAQRVQEALEEFGVSWELIFVDDASPDDVVGIVRRLGSADARIRLAQHESNRGQHRAILTGLAMAGGDVAVVMDGDLQDRPEAIPELLAALREGRGAVFAARRGAYQARGRLVTSRLFKTVLGWLTGVPPDAGTFFAVTRAVREKMVTCTDDSPWVVSLVGLFGRPIATVPTTRDERPRGASSYSGWDRLRLALGALAFTLRWRLGPRAWRWAIVAACGIFGIAWYGAAIGRFPIGIFDESYLYLVAQRLAEGARPYVEIHLHRYLPTAFAPIAAVFAAIGPSVIAARVVLAAMLAILVPVKLAVARRVTPMPFAALATAALVVVPGPWYKFYVGLAALLLLATLLDLLDDESPGVWLRLGLALGLAALARMDIAIAGVVLIVLVLVLRRWCGGSGSAKGRARPWLLVGVALPLAPALAWYARGGVLADHGRQWLGFFSSLSSSALSHPTERPPVAAMFQPSLAGLESFLFWGSFVPLLALSLVVLVEARSGRKGAAQGALLLAWALASVPQYALEHPGVAHFTTYGFAFVLPAAAVAGRLWPLRRQPASRALLGFLAIHLIAFVGVHVGRRVGGAVAPLGPRANWVRLASGMTVPGGTTGGLPRLVDRLVTASRPGDRAIGLPFCPGVNFAACLPLPGRLVHVIPQVYSAEVEAELLADLEQTRWVIYLPEQEVSGPGSRLVDFAPRVHETLRRDYRVVDRSGEIEVLERASMR